MRVLEITGEPILHGGQEQFIYNFVSNLRDESFTVDVLTPYNEDNTQFKDLITDRGGKVIAFGMDFNPGKSRKCLFKPVKIFLQTNQYDVVHIHSGSISVLAYMAKAAYKAGVKRVIVHSHSTGMVSTKHSLTRIAFSGMLKRYPTDYFACSYDAGADKFPSSIVQHKLDVIKNGIDLTRFRRNRDTRGRIRTDLGISEKEYVVGHVGRFSYQKNHDFLVDVFNDIHSRHPNTRMLLVGDGELMETVKAKIGHLNLEDSVVLTGNVDNTQDYYQAMDVFAFPSRFEGFGLVALEAQAVGLPCIISSEIPKDVIIGDKVISASIEDSKAWVNAIEGYLGENNVDNYLAIVNAGYDIKETVATIVDIYSKEK